MKEKGGPSVERGRGDMTGGNEKVRENRLRRTAARQRLRLEKSRRRDPNTADYGTYQLVDVDTKLLRFAKHWNRGYGMSLDDIEEYLRNREAAPDPGASPSARSRRRSPG